MATSLQQQLAVINARSTDQLNLKAQKARHSQSLLFEPREASKQSFDTLFQICQEGFAELCQLDRRYVSFAQGLFAESSISVEREHMTAGENQEVDLVIDQFLGLVSGKLLLRPAQKSVEWLVRRWRIHEYNTSTMLLAFLPYHSHDIFPTVLSILPKKIPSSFNFIRPYVAALENPPRHALVAAAISNPSFISAYSTFVLSAARRKLQSSFLVGSWISVLAQSLNAKLDNALSGRDVVRRQKSEDVLLEILPTLQEMLAISDAPDLFLSACMIMTILATKVDLQDRVLDSFMESVVTSWTRDTIRDAAECLAVLAEEKENASMPSAVFDKIIRSDVAVSAILSLENHVRVEKLIGSIVQSIRAIDTAASYMQTAAVQRIVERAQSEESLATTQQPPPEDVEMLDTDELSHNEMDHAVNTQNNEVIIANLAKLPAKPYSFLTADHALVLNDYMSAFEKCSGDASSRAALLRVQDLHPADHQRPETLSFLAGCWTTSLQKAVRRIALELAAEHITADDVVTSYQAIYPYVLCALCDSSPHVRRAAAQLFVIMRDREAKADHTTSIWARTSIYAAASNQVKWLSAEAASVFLHTAIVPRLEDCILDPTAMLSSITDFLNDKATAFTARAAICDFLMSHATLSGIREVQLNLFGLLSKVNKASIDAKKTILVPFVALRAQHSSNEERTLTAELKLFGAAVQCLSHRSDEEIDALKSVASSSLDSGKAGIAFTRLGRLFRSCKIEVQLSLAAWLFAQAVKAADETIAQPRGGAALETLRALPLPVEALVLLLSSATKSSDRERPSKRQRISKGAVSKVASDVDPSSLSEALRRSTLCLELVEDALSQIKSPAEVSQHYAQLVKRLFSMLGDIQTWRLATGSDLVYLQALALNNILSTLDLISGNTTTAQPIDHSYLRTDMIVEVLRSTSSPQIHNSALLVISKIATFAPDAVLHSVMPLFTFMSSSTLRQADAYSVHVINMTIESIVPPLRQSLKARGKDLVAGASDLLLSFTAAFEHIPGHRRHDTFVQLLKVLGAKETLYAIMAMLIERYHEDTTCIGTLQAIMASFDVQTQAQALAQYLNLVADACKKRRGLSDTILGFGEKNAAETNSSVAVLLDGWASLVSSSSLRSRVAMELRQEEAAQNLRESYSVLLEKLISLPHKDTNTANFEEPRLRTAHDTALKALLALLPTEEFITSSADLMQAGSEQARVRVFGSLTDRVHGAKGGDTRLAEVFIESLPNCSVFVSTSQPVSVRRAALECVDAICEKFGKRDREAVSNVTQVLLTDAALLSDTPVLQIAALLGLASAVEVLREEFVAIAGPALLRTLDLIEATLNSTNVDWSLLDAAFTLVNAVLDHEAWLIGASLLDRAILLVCQTQELDDEKSWSAKQFCSLVPRQTKMHDLLAAIERVYESVTSLGEDAMTTRAQMIQASIACSSKSIVTQHATLLGTLMLRSFGLRRVSDEELDDDEDDTTLEAYDLSIQWALEMTLKMNDITFRPPYMRLVAWAESGDAQTSKSERQLALYDFSSRLFEQLGSIMTTYASFVLDNASTLLMSDRTGQYWAELATAVLKTLTASFKHDQDDFWSAPQHFDTIDNALLSLVTQPLANDNNIVHNAVVELAAAVSGSSEHLKTMNSKIMMALRNANASVRLEAVRCERKVTDRLTFDWLNLLPEMLPYISELLEDDDEAIEREVLGWVAEIEKITGESLEGMLS